MFKFLCPLLVASSLCAFSLKSLLTYTFPDKSYDYEKAKKIYFKKRCAQCHGPKGMQITFATSKPIARLTAAEIKGSLISYANGLGNKKSKGVMSFYASNLSEEDMNYIIAYLKGPNFALDIKKREIQKEETEENTSSAGTFLE